ncbi:MULTISPECIES: SAM-dependent methyltransferase [unclassified Mycobacterium]|uniref:SAM-dependent methyltransferase n=1 Tax=unclassified Mycobacterium TaxID=2642494 RepID=UPI0029C9A3A2|nr:MULTISPECIES: SAM-dependent methyltransferase [unclassified Mycobacterium]
MPRTDDDTWDLTEGVGTTATAVAAARALASCRPHPLIDDPFARPLVAALGIEHYVRVADGDTGDDAAGIDWDAVADGMAVRTQFFDEFLTDAMTAGVRQAVILACGLDTRAYRLAWPPGTTIYELDQPGVVEFKARTMSDLGAAPAADVRCIGIDLRDDWPNALRVNGFDAAQPTAWIAEGLLGYLPPEAQDLLFDNVTELSATGSRLATEWHPDLSVTATPSSTEVTRAERDRSNGSDIQDPADMIYFGERSDVEEYLTAAGWNVATHTFAARAEANGIAYSTDESVAGLFRAHLTAAILG